ncbi:hypothetical protein C5167_030095 [Papaver somniferum]|nr:hypothetical protein C5167_030095 [Papaver somniferum]
MNSSTQIFNHFFFILSFKKTKKKLQKELMITTWGWGNVIPNASAATAVEADICCWPFLLVLLQRKLQKCLTDIMTLCPPERTSLEMLLLRSNHLLQIRLQATSWDIFVESYLR